MRCDSSAVVESRLLQLGDVASRGRARCRGGVSSRAAGRKAAEEVHRPKQDWKMSRSGC